MDVTGIAVLVVVVLVIFSSLKNSVAPGPSYKYLSKPYVTITPEEKPRVTENIRNYIFKSIKNRLNADSVNLMADSIVKKSCDFGVDPILVTALIKRESGFIPDTVSRSGAVGLGQIKPSTAQGLGVTNLYDIDENIKATAAYLREMLDRWIGNENQIKLALASYKEGYGTVSRAGGRYSEHTAGYINDILRICGEINSINN